MKTYRLFLILLFAASSFCFAQDLQVQIIMTPRPSPYLTDWQDKSETIQLAVTNLSEQEYSFRIGAKVYAGSQFDENLQAATKVLSMPVHTILGFESVVFDGVDIVPYEAIEFYNNVEQSVIRTGKLPSRYYTICLTLYDEVTGAELTAPVCRSFFLDSYQQPNLIYPLDNSDIPITSLQGQVFRWSPVTPTPSGIVNYTLFGMRVESWQQPMQAFKVNQPFFEVELPLQTQSIWPPDFDLPKVGETVVWSVRSTDAEGKPIGEQEGVASPFVFNVIDAGFDKADLCDCKPVTEGAAIRAAKEMGAEAYDEGNEIVISKGEPETALVAHEAAHVVQQKSGVNNNSTQNNITESYDDMLSKMRVSNPDVEIVYNWKFFGINDDGESFTDESDASKFVIDYPNLTEGRLSVTGMIICADATCQFADEIKITVDGSSNKEKNEEDVVFEDIPDGSVVVSPVDSDGDGEIDYIDFKSTQRQTPKTDFGSVLGKAISTELVVDEHNSSNYTYIDCFPTRYVFPAFSSDIPNWDGMFSFIFKDENGNEYKGFTESEHLIFAPFSSGSIQIQYAGTLLIDGVHPLLFDTMGININFLENENSTEVVNRDPNNKEYKYEVWDNSNDTKKKAFSEDEFPSPMDDVGPVPLFPDGEFPSPLDDFRPVSLFSDEDFQTLNFKLPGYNNDEVPESNSLKMPVRKNDNGQKYGLGSKCTECERFTNKNTSESVGPGNWSSKFEPADGSPPIYLFLENSDDFLFLPPCSGILEVNFKGKVKEDSKKDGKKKDDPIDLNFKKIIIKNPTVNKNKGKEDTEGKKTTDLTIVKEADVTSPSIFIGPLEKLEKNKLKLENMTSELDYTEVIIPTPKYKPKKLVPTFQNYKSSGTMSGENPLYNQSRIGGDCPLYEGLYNEFSTNLKQTNYYVLPSDITYVDQTGKTQVISTNINDRGGDILLGKRDHDHIGNFNFSISFVKEVLNFNGSSDGVEESFEPTVIRADYSVPPSEMNKSDLINEIHKATYTKYGSIQGNIKNNGQSCGNKPQTNISQNTKQHKSAPLIRVYVEGVKTTDVKETQIRYAPVGSDELSDDPNEMADLIQTWFSDNKIQSNKLIKAKVYENTLINHFTEAARCTVLGSNFGNKTGSYYESPTTDYWGLNISENNFELKQSNYRDILVEKMLTNPINATVETKNNSAGPLRWMSPESINLKIYSQDDFNFRQPKSRLFSSDKDLMMTTPLLYLLFHNSTESYNYVKKHLSTISPIVSQNSLSGGSFELSKYNLAKGKMYVASLTDSENPNNSTIVPFWIPEVDDEVLTTSLTGGSDILNIEQGFKITSPSANDEYDLLDVEYKFTRLGNDQNTFYTVYYENSYANKSAKKKDCDSLAAVTENPFGPNESEEWIALSDSLRQAESDLEYWKRRCPQEDEKDEVRASNQKILDQNIERLKQWAKELGITLPENAECNFKECCPPNGDCCEGIDPNTPEGRAAYLEKMRCISRKLNQLNSTMNADMSNFIDQMNFWNQREDSRNQWIMYDWYFSNVEWILSGGPITDAIDYMKEKTGYNDVVEWLGQEAWNRFCNMNNLTPQQCEDAKQLLRDIQAAKEKYDNAKEAADAVKEIVNAARTGGGFPPGLIIKMTAMMAGAVAELTGDMVAFYNAKFIEMGGTAKSVMMTMLCLKQYYAMIAQMKEKCGNFCEEAISNLEADVARLEKEKERVRSAFFENEDKTSKAAEESIDEAIARILEHFSDPFGRNRMKCCPNGSETIVYNFPQDEEKNECSKMVASQLKLSLGERYCWMKIKVIIICTPQGTEIKYEYETLKERNKDCCPDDIDEVPLGGRSGGDMGTGSGGAVKPPTGGATAGGGRVRVGGSDGGANGGGGGSAGRGERSTPWQPGPKDGPPHRGDNGKCKCDIKLTYNGKGLKPNGKIIVDYDDPATIIAAGKCEGDCFKDGNWLEVDPPPMNNFPFINIPPTKIKGTTYSTLKNLGFTIPGTWTFRFYQRCSDGSVCSVGLTIVVKKPKDPDKGDPDFENDTTEIRGADCGRDTCLQVDYNHYKKRRPTKTMRMAADVILRRSVGITKLDIDTQCKEICPNDPNKLTWLIYRPDGRLDTKKGINLYSIKYDFDIIGKYKICIIEEKGCKIGAKRVYSRTFYVDVK